MLRFASSLSGASQGLLDGSAIAASGKGCWATSWSVKAVRASPVVWPGQWGLADLAPARRRRRKGSARRALAHQVLPARLYDRWPRPLLQPLSGPPAGRELVETDHDHKVYFHRLGTPAGAMSSSTPDPISRRSSSSRP